MLTKGVVQLAFDILEVRVAIGRVVKATVRLKVVMLIDKDGHVEDGQPTSAIAVPLPLAETHSVLHTLTLHLQKEFEAGMALTSCGEAPLTHNDGKPAQSVDAPGEVRLIREEN